MLGIAIGHRIARIGRLDPEGRPTVTATDLAGTDGVADPATALTMLLAEVTGEEAVATGEEAVLGLPAAAGREAEADLRRAAEDAGLRVNRIVPEPVAVALHYGAIDEGVHRTVLVVDQAATTVDLTVLAITPDLTVRIVTTRTAQLADDHALTAIAQELTEAAPDAVLLSGDLYTTPAHRTDIENLADAQGLTMRCRTPELAVVHGLLLLEDFGLLRIATGPAPARTHFPSPLEDPEPQPWSIPVADPEPQNAPPDNAPKGPGAVPTPPRGREQPPPPDSEPPTATTPPIPTPEPEVAPIPTPEPEPEPEPETPRPEPAQASTVRSVPVTQLQAIRRDDHLLVLWAWPDSALTARVRWRREDVTTAGDGPRDGDIRCQRRVYEHDGGLDLPVGRGAVTLTVEALVPDPAVDTEGAASLRIPAEPPIVEYEPSLRRRLTGARVATVTFTARTGCDLPALRIVHGLGRYRPTSTAEGTVLHEVPAQRLPAGAPLIVEFPLPSTKGPSWLVCFPVDGPDSGPDSEQDRDIDIRPTALHRLRVT
ncbi:Hsp70 family protein [Streptomyces sp. NBS 14/10]|uniref:Hsp70 family protein n=1 Tax=Streptomyces sp. NBS 14/10 TaxID=1945643 RepID=UPI000B7F9DF6|nr:Hsp70 family protein [Streptomyces sp. NBS 14/10]KAK1185593.1 Hsp70 family protein [Streptomyces sp. NBS 14/10]